MRILGFDTAIKNLGIFCIKYNVEWMVNIKKSINVINNILTNINDYDIDEFLNIIEKELRIVNSILQSIIIPTFFNVVDLTANSTSAVTDNSKSVTDLELTSSLKYLLSSLNLTIGPVDKVLIEYQMRPNTTMANISGQITYHYSQSDGTIIEKTKTQTNPQTKTPYHLQHQISYAVSAYPIKSAIPSGSETSVEIVGASLKNSYKIAPDGDYVNFITKYSNYTANKKHTVHNFKYFMEIFGYSEQIKDIPNKLADIADSFCMIWAWLKKNEML